MNSPQPQSAGGQYQVVALKYRPQSFTDLIGQDHIASALSNAISQNRVGHAYLFTGARGVGKTSSARIFAKCLNCETGPTSSPCGQCDICTTVSVGEDVDVLEIDGASNRGIDEIRQLRSNASIRPSRSRYKIYIIDEVHMLTTQAFNALLKTLEEPPLHVKFIFCTTDPQKIPITVLSRCQRFDFSPVQTDEIAKSLKAIAEQEGVTATDQALSLLARRANGSMRDSQSLLEQLLSFCDQEITVEEVNQLLGTADVGSIADIAAAIADRDSAATLNLINQAAHEGVNAGQLAGQLLGYFRDMMAVRVGCGEDTLLTCAGSDLDSLNARAEQLGLETILTIVQIFDSAVVRMQSSLHARTLLEVAAIRASNLENLDSISDLVNHLADSGAAGTPKGRPKIAPSKNRVELKKVSPAPKKNEITETATKSNAAADAPGPNEVSDSPHSKIASVATSPTAAPNQIAPEPTASLTPSLPKNSAQLVANDPPNGKARDAASEQVKPKPPAQLSKADLQQKWAKTLAALGDMTADLAANYEKLELPSPAKLVVTLKDPYHCRECNKAERKQKIEQTFSDVVGSNFKVEFLASKKSAAATEVKAPKMTRAQQIRKLHEDNFVQQTMSLFDAEISNFYQSPAKSRKTVSG